MKGTVRGVGYLVVGILTILGGIIMIGMMLSATHVSLNFVLQGLLIAICVLEMVIGLMAIYYGINRLQVRISDVQ